MKHKPFITIIFICLFNLISISQPLAEKTINYRLKWLYNTSVAGDLFALEKNYFKDAGLTVDVKAGGPERDAIRELELGHAHFGVASADQVIRARAKGAPVIVIAQIFQQNPLQWIYRIKNGEIKSLTDLSGKTIGITYGGNDETIMHALLSKGNINEKNVRFFSVRYDYTPFYQDKVHMWPVYSNSQAIILEEKLTGNRERILFFRPSDYGIQFVANSVVTSEKFLESDPDTVQRFINALVSGWEAAMEINNEREVLEVLKKYDRDTPSDIRKKQLEKTRCLVIPESGEKIGTIDIPAWRQTEEIMRKQHLIENAVPVEKYLFPSGSGKNWK